MRGPRRSVLAALGALLLAPLVASGQSSGRIPRIGVLESSPASAFPDRVEALRRGLAELGYVEGKTIALELRWSDGKGGDLPRLAADLVHEKVDLIVAGTTVAAVAAKNATGTLPIVFAVPSDPVGVGLVTSLARPGGHLTGLTIGNTETAPKRLELLKELLPSVPWEARASTPPSSSRGR